MRLFIAITLLLLAAGCGSGTRVSGKVVFEDGTPLTKGVIVFDDNTHSFQGAMRSNGTYFVGQAKDSQKIPTGRYKVWFSATQRIETVYDSKGNATNETVTFPLLLDEYTASNRTELEADVTKGGRMTFDFTVKHHPDWDKQQQYGPSDTPTDAGKYVK
ncbi:MAG: hypothetical protein LBT46_07595 [Planctomycetaceae bacterium]|jgi:hypothetical protein|nr:hypothetical protein [Planctomycetaceae bacterium]